MERRRWGGELVVGPETLLSFFDQSGPPQVGQVARGFGLGHLDNRDDVADAHFSFQEKVQDAEPGAVGEGSKHQVDSWSGHIYIRLGEYSTFRSFVQGEENE
jgi:hypothetical protein